MWPWEKEQQMGNDEKENERNRRKQATWRSKPENKKKNNEDCRKWQKEHPDQVKNWRAEHPDRVKEHQKKQYATEEHRAYMREYMRKRRAAEKAQKESENKKDNE